MTPGSVLIFLILPVLLDRESSEKRSRLFFFFFFSLQSAGCPAFLGSLETHIFQCHLTLPCLYQSYFSNSKEHIQLSFHYQDKNCFLLFM